MITDREKLEKMVRKLREVMEDELSDDYTGSFRLDFKIQNGGINGKIVVAKER
jgi:hypothetical protein